MYILLKIFGIILLGLMCIFLPIYMFYLAFSSKNYDKNSKTEKVEFKDCIRLIINEGLLKKDRLKYFSINPNQETIVRY